MVGGDGPRGPRRRRRAVWITVGVVALALVGLIGWLGFQVLTVRNELGQAQAAVGELRSGGDIGDNLHKLDASAAVAGRAASDPVWAVAEQVPVAGDNLRAVRVAAQTLDELSNGVALPVLDGMKGDGGSLAALIRPLQAAQPKVSALSAELADLPTDNLVPEVRDGVAQVKSVMKLVTPAVRFLPGLLGADGPKNYLVVAQNNAELMPLGGSAASHTLIRVDAGKLSIVKQVTSQDFDYVTPLKQELPIGVIHLYGPIMKTHPNATVSRPDWPTAASLLQQLWNRDISKDRIDGVASLDPIALSYLLKATGPVTMPDGQTLTSDNIVKVALSDSYAKYGDTGDHGNSYFKAIAMAVFERVAGGGFDPKVMLQAIQEGVRNRSLMFWSADADLEKFVASTKLGGVLPHTNKVTTSIGVFFRDHSMGTKIDYYMQPTTTVTTACRADGTTVYTVKVDLKLNIGKATEKKLPDYVRAHLPHQRYDTEVFIYGPLKSHIEGYQEGKGAVFRWRVKDLDRRVLKFVVSTKPGETGSLTATYTVAPGAKLGPTEVLTTPTVHPVKISLEGQACEASR